MIEANLEVVKEAAKRLLFDLPEEEYETLLSEFSAITNQMTLLGQCADLDAYEPMTYPFDCSIDFLREDEPATPLSPEEALGNAGSTSAQQIKLPKVVG